jgi:hypothetical protein
MNKDEILKQIDEIKWRLDSIYSLQDPNEKGMTNPMLLLTCDITNELYKLRAMILDCKVAGPSQRK